jgi:DNA-binding transcriptional regulator of glucitol operon
MSKNVLVISTSPRKNGNSEILADEFIKGATDSGNAVEKVVLYDKQIGFCIGCFVCQKTQKCVIKDDASEIVEKMLHADIIAFATPVYFHDMCGQMKTLLDRSNPLYPSDYKFRDIYLIATAADDVKTCTDGTIKGMEGWVQCFEKAKLNGIVCGLNALDVGDINKQPIILKQAYDMGKTV